MNLTIRRNKLSQRFKDNNIIRIRFIGILDLKKGSDRIFAYYFNKYLNQLENIESTIEKEYTDNIASDILIFKKGYPTEKICKIRESNQNIILGIINPTDNSLVTLKAIDFAIVGSVEEKSYYTKYKKCFIYPLIEEVSTNLITEYNKRPRNIICYHGNKQHLDLIDINIERALLRLVKEGYEVKAIYDHKKLGKTKKKFITKHVQWNNKDWLKEISFSTVGICPVSHYNGQLRRYLAKSIYLKRENWNDFLFQYKNTINSSRAFVFHQLKIPVVSEIGGSFHHIMGDETAGYLCYSENSWYESIKKLCINEKLSIEFSEKAFILMNKLYNPSIWCERFIEQLKEWTCEE